MFFEYVKPHITRVLPIKKLLLSWVANPRHARFLLFFGVAIFMASKDTRAENPDAYQRAFEAYQNGSYREAHRLLTPLAQQGEVQAQLALSLLYEQGLGVKADSLESLKWYEKAALQGDPVIQYELGLTYFNGKNTTVDYDKAATWWLKAAAQEHAGAQYNLGLMYIKGKGFDENIRMATEWMSKAAQQNYGPAHYSLGVIHATGNGTERNYGKAFKHFKVAAPQGIVEAQYNLGVAYEKGRGTPINLERAQQWYELAAKQGLKKAAQKLMKLSNQRATSTSLDSASKNRPEMPAKPIDRANMAYQWIGRQFPVHYTLQLIVLSDETAVIRFIDAYQIPDPHAYYPIKRGAERLYRVIHGNFATHSEAAAARDKLSQQHDDLSPLITQFATVQKQLRKP